MVDEKTEQKTDEQIPLEVPTIKQDTTSNGASDKEKE